MKEKDINTILIKYFTKSISTEEEKELSVWINKSDNNASIFRNLKNVWKERTMDPDLVTSDALIDEIWDKGVKGNQKSIIRSWKTIYNVAALFVVFFIAGFLVTREVNVFNSNNAIISKAELVTKISPSGEKRRITLSEGSTIYLNSGSEIRYNKNFSDTSRMIYLKGEAFFEVSHDSKRPFTVTTEMSSTTALGTSFNINTQYHETDQIALFDGKVKVVENVSGKPLLLDKGELAIVNVGNKVFRKTTFEENIVGGWKKGILIFSSASFDDFIKKIELWYNVTVVLEGEEPQDWIFTAQYENETLENILLNLSFERDFSYEIINNNLTLKFE